MNEYTGGNFLNVTPDEYASSSEKLASLIQKDKQRDEKFFTEAFTNPVTKEPYRVPNNIKRLSTCICRSYNITGICDPMYIANIIALELGKGDGQGHFND